jgi:DnaJ-class molecular chaperone
MSTGNLTTSTETATCTRCGGTGNIPCFRHIDGGECYACDGTGHVAGAPRKLPRGHVAGKTVDAGRFGKVFVSRAAKGHLVATNARGEEVPFLVVAGKVSECDWYTRYNGRTTDLLAVLQGALKV